MYKTHFYQGSDTHKVIYIKYSNMLAKVKALSKQKYFEKERNNNRKLLGFVLPCSVKKSSSFPSKLKFDGVKIDNPDAILECFNSKVLMQYMGARFAENINSNNSYDFKKSCVAYFIIPVFSAYPK